MTRTSKNICIPFALPRPNLLSQVLEEHRVTCEKAGNYIEAELAKNKIKELKEQNERRKREELKTRHLNEVSDRPRTALQHDSLTQ